MASVTGSFIRESYGYPTSDGKPMAESDQHRILMTDLIMTLSSFFEDDPDVYVSGNLIVCFVPGNKRRHLSPDVFVVRGVPKGDRPNYLTWIEGKGPDTVIELTSSTTRHADTHRKFALYRDVLRVPEYFLFDPRDDYLEPRLQGFRLIDGRYVPIALVEDRLPSAILGLHLEAAGQDLRLWHPETGEWLPTPRQIRAALQTEAQARRQAEQRLRQAEQRARRAEADRQAERQARQIAEQQTRQAQDELARLRHELEESRRPPAQPPEQP
jgi:Uma2 family endonuclease